MPSPPSTASSASDAPAPHTPHTGARRDPPLQPPRPLFFIDRGKASTTDITDEDRRSPALPLPALPAADPFRSPDSSVPPTPAAAPREQNPFSPPASIISVGSVGTFAGVGGADTPHVTIHAHSRVHSRVSIGSSIGRGPGSSLSSAGDVPPVPGRPGLGARAGSTMRDSFMSPPVMTRRGGGGVESSAASRLSVAAPKSKRMRSSMLAGAVEKPWVGERDVYGRLAWWITYCVAFLGVAGSAVRCYFAWRDVPRVGNLCLVMEDQFETLDTEFTWTREVDMGGFGNGEFEMTTASPNNSFVADGHLYIVPTLTSDVIGYDNVLNGYTYNISGCTNANLTACGAVSNATAGAVINPVMSARLTTRGSHHITYGKVEIVAKLPAGDWLWPSLWMLPVDDAYGPWPASGEIDIMTSRGNSPEYKAQGRDVVRGQLNWGPFTWLTGLSKTYGWWADRRASYADGFHTYAVEWTDEFIRIYVDSRLHHMLQLSFDEPFFARGAFPPFVQNGSETVATPDPWTGDYSASSNSGNTDNAGTSGGRGTGKGQSARGLGVNGANSGDNRGRAAPFDKPFYVVMDVAAGGTNGWFPDGVGGKPWFDSSSTAMREFATAQDEWAATWPTDPKERALVVDSVKMWQKC